MAPVNDWIEKSFVSAEPAFPGMNIVTKNSKISRIDHVLLFLFTFTLKNPPLNKIKNPTYPLQSRVNQKNKYEGTYINKHMFPSLYSVEFFIHIILEDEFQRLQYEYYV